MRTICHRVAHGVARALAASAMGFACLACSTPEAATPAGDAGIDVTTDGAIDDAAAPCTISGCPAGEYCDGAQRRCLFGCGNDDDCVSDASRARCALPAHACVSCLEDVDCPAGTRCTGHACAPGCNDAQPCAPGSTCCDGACVDPQSNDAHCGACAQSCEGAANGAARCTGGTCMIASCTAPWADCDGLASNGCEVSTQKDALHCGACGAACATAHGATACVNGVCTAATCAAPYMHCAAAGSDCESNLSTNVASCGFCGHKCADGQACVQGACVASPCPGTTRDCDGDGDGSCETDTATNVANCGACGNVCVVPNGTAACVAGKCAVAACTGTYADCDHDPRNGCEVDVATSSDNCGRCGSSCFGRTCRTFLDASMLSLPQDWIFNEAAFYDAELGSAVLTPYVEPGHNPPARGSFMYTTRIELDAFVARFDFRIGNEGGQPGEGLGLVLSAQDSPTIVGNLGSGIGMAGLGGYGVEFDTRGNSCDGQSDHVGIDDLTGNTCAFDDGTPKLLAYNVSLPFPLENTGWHTAVIRWTANVVSVTLDGALVIDGYAIPNLIAGGFYFLGFTASYSSVFTCRHEIRNVRIDFPTPRCL